jgi:uroporphyrin-III C-methyltransferase/precorrin-2 dehydrogenase/sirohydrochlorin ferrochelatase
MQAVTSRTPSERPARIEPLARLPIFMDLAGRKALVVGGGPPAAWKAELLAAAGANVTVISQDLSDEMREIAAVSTGITVVERPFEPADLIVGSIAIADLGEADAPLFACPARAAGVIVNVVDKPEYCDFAFGTIVNRSPVVVGISTDGAAPILGQAIRRRIETLLPHALAGWADKVKTMRDQVAKRLLSPSHRRTFLGAFHGSGFLRKESGRL